MTYNSSLTGYTTDDLKFTDWVYHWWLMTYISSLMGIPLMTYSSLTGYTTDDWWPIVHWLGIPLMTYSSLTGYTKVICVQGKSILKRLLCPMTDYFGWQFSYILNDRSWNQSWPVLNTSSTPSWAEVCLLIMDMALSTVNVLIVHSSWLTCVGWSLLTDILPTAKYLLKALSLIKCGRVLLEWESINCFIL